ncbi:Serine--tRNA synthetase-like protein Slimp [Anthophora retusa]
MATCILHLLSKYMVHQNLKHTLKYINKLVKCNRQYSSALLPSSGKSKNYFSFLTPYFDFDERLTNVEKLQKTLAARGLNWNVEDIKNVWQFYKTLHADKSKLKLKVQEISKELTPLYVKENRTTHEELECSKLKMQIKIVKQDLQSINAVISDLNDSVVDKMLQLPNEIDGRTPLQTPVILRRVNSLNENSHSANRKNHIEIGKSLGLLEYKNPMQYYLCNDAALFELGVLSYAGKIFSEDNMIRVAGADFSRSLVVDGSGLNHEDPADAFIIDNHIDVEEGSPNHMHLVGGASLMSLLAMHAKQIIEPNHFPVAYFSTGRQYTPFRPGTTPIGLFTVCQASAALAFILVKDSNSKEYHDQFEKLLNTVCKLYDNLCDHYQIVIRPAPELRAWEAMRVSFELWSTSSKQYIEVGHISVCGEYFSKRLLIGYRSSKGRAFPSVISGTVLSVPRLLGCLLEQNPDKFVIPPKVMEHMPINSPSH